MRTFTNKEFSLFEKIVGMTDKQLFNVMRQVLTNRYDQVITDEKNYLVTIGNIDIALVAHLDTVFDYPAREVYYDIRKGICWSPDGLGSDDRSGVFAILNIIQRGLRPSIIFTMGEEQGGIGAQALSKLECPIPNLKYMIELDRQGSTDMVFYNCYCPEFIAYVERFGFFEKKGSYSDISFLMEPWQICGVNLSIGYLNEHSYGEILDVNAMFATIDKVETMLKDKNIPTFKFSKVTNELKDWYRSSNRDYEDMIIQCTECKENVFDFETFNYKGRMVCCDCYEKLLMEEK